MKKTIIFAKACAVLAFACCIVGCATGPQVTQDPVRVLYLGDSLSDFDRGSNHVDRLQARLDALQPRAVNIYNYSIRGDFIDRMMDRIHGKKGTYALDRYNGIWGPAYDWAFVFLGHNDTRAWSETQFAKADMSAEQVRKGYTELISILKSKGIRRIILVSPASSNFELTSANAEKRLAAMKAGKTPKKNVVRYGDPKLMEAFADELKALAAAEDGVEYFDLYTDMKALPDKASYLNPSDGVHLSAKGHAYIADRTYDYLTR